MPFNLFEFTITHEGFVAKPYIDPLVAKDAYGWNKSLPLTEDKFNITGKEFGYPDLDNIHKFTIGYGQLCRYVEFPAECDKDMARGWLEKALNEKRIEVMKKLINDGKLYKIDSRHTDILTAIAYQIGVAGLLKFKKALSLLSAGQITGAKLEFLNSNWARQTPRRANELVNYIT